MKLKEIIERDREGETERESSMKEEHLDYVVVPLGLAVMGAYHVWLFITILRSPSRTVIGINAQSRRQWVFSLMAVSSLLSPRFFFQIPTHICFTIPQKKKKKSVRCCSKPSYLNCFSLVSCVQNMVLFL